MDTTPRIPPSALTLTATQLAAIYGRNLELAMTRADMTSAQLAEEVGATTDIINRVRRNPKGRFIDPELLLKFCELFDCEVLDLLLPQPGVRYTALEGK